MSLWPQVITGVVGLAGIAGTIVSARLAAKVATKNLVLSVAAEDRRAHKAEKRRVYTACLTVFNEMSATSSYFRTLPSNLSDSLYAEEAKKRDEAVHGVWRSVEQVDLIGSPKAIEAVVELANALTDQVHPRPVRELHQEPSAAEIRKMRMKLIAAFREDLESK